MTTVAEVRRAFLDPDLVILQGLHAVKHAMRFGADVVAAVTPDPEALTDLAERLAPDVAAAIAEVVAAVPSEDFASLPDPVPATGVLAAARRPEAPDPAAVLASPNPEPVVVLDRPRHLGNVGAAIRVAAAAGAAGVLVVGEADPWHPQAVRGAAGLQYALPLAVADELPPGDRAIIAAHPTGETLQAGGIGDRSAVVLGSERWGVSPGLLAGADRILTIPMRPGVSSLNLATAVAVMLYARRLGG